MKTTKKFLSILLATILILSVFPVTLAQASETAITFTAETDAQNVKVGDTVSVSVNMSEYNNLGALTLYVNYDSTALEIVDVQTNNAFGYEEFNTAYNGSKFAYLTASASPKTVSGTLFTIYFEVLKEGCTEISLSVDELADIDYNPLSSSTKSAFIHKFDSGIVTPPTCLDKGYTTYACACGYSYQTNETDAKGHNFVNGTCTECGEKSVKWKFDEETGTLTIYGTGPMEDYYDEKNNRFIERPWENFCNDIKLVVIEDGVTTIGDGSFVAFENLENATISNTVTIVGNSAFNSCINLTSVVIPDSVTIIGGLAFVLCESLTSITIPDSVTSIGANAFAHCTKITNIIIPDSVTSIGFGAFQCCDNLTNLIIGNGINSITDEAFFSCYNLTNLTITDSVKTIGENTFSSCNNLTDVYYLGSGDEWDAISIESENYPLLNARIHCNSTGADTHPFNPVVTPPTCTEQGFTTYTCACGYSNGVVDNYVDATGHSYTSEITTPATHLADGVMTFTCYCGDSYTEVVEKIAEHNHNSVVTPPTCTAQGFTTYTCECGDTYVADYVDANGHSYNPVVTPPTCTEGGYTTYTCTVCDDNYVDDKTSATGHSYTSKITKPATHTENGEMTFTCACGDTYTETINATGDHFYTPTVTPPTCTEGGYTTYICVCGDTYVADETSATGHDYDYDNGVLVRPRENRNGYYMYFCKNDAEHMIFESVESAGYTEYDKAIEKLNEYLADSNLTDEAKEFIVSGCVEIIKNNDEFYEDGIRERRDLIASEQHIIDKVTNELNEHYQVVDSFIANCEAGNHDVKEYVSDGNATCTVNGTKRGTCYYCGTEVIADDENNSALGHDIVVDNAVAPDCINTGLTEGSHCSRCDDATTEQKVVPALGHSYENGICTVCDNADPDYFAFSVKEPSRTTIRNKDSINLHAEFEGIRPEGSYVEWTSSNNNFNKIVMNDGDSLQVIANNKGNTTFTATLYDANGNALATDTVELYSQSGFFDKIGGFFRYLFGTTKIYES